jgi:hypothetical protein
MINGTTSVLKSYIFQICAAIYQLLLHMVFTSHNWFAMQGPVAIILISWNVISIWETGYWTRAIKRFALFDLLKSLYSDTKILSKYIPSLQNQKWCGRRGICGLFNFQLFTLISIQGPSWTGSYGSWIYNYLCNQCPSPITLWVRTPFMARCTQYNIMW